MITRLITTFLLGLLTSSAVSAQSVSSGSEYRNLLQCHSFRASHTLERPQYRSLTVASPALVFSGNSSSLIPPSFWTPGVSISDFLRPSQPFLSSRPVVHSLPSAPVFSRFHVNGINFWQALGIVGIGVAQQLLDQNGSYPDL